MCMFVTFSSSVSFSPGISPIWGVFSTWGFSNSSSCHLRISEQKLCNSKWWRRFFWLENFMAGQPSTYPPQNVTYPPRNSPALRSAYWQLVALNMLGGGRLTGHDDRWWLRWACSKHHNIHRGVPLVSQALDFSANKFMQWQVHTSSSSSGFKTRYQ